MLKHSKNFTLKELFKINKVKIEVEKIRSYQTLVYKNGHRTFAKKEYKQYKQELGIGLNKLKSIKKDKPFRINLYFNVKDSFEPCKWRVKLKSTHNTSKVFNNEYEALKYIDEDKHFMEYVEEVIKYGSVPDVDNAMKPVIDYLEEIGKISNDRYAVETHIYKTFGNEVESIEVELIEMESYIDGNVKFKEKEI